jgi:hypothetical protein
LVELREFFSRVLPGDSASFTAYYFGLAKLHNSGFHKDGRFVAQRETVDCRSRLFRNQKIKNSRSVPARASIINVERLLG